MGELEVLRAQWQGAGGRSFDAARLRWSEDVTRLNSALTETAAALRTSAGHYSATDDAAAGRFGPAGAAPITLPL
jgi:WXG100 family type VII secretion target